MVNLLCSRLKAALKTHEELQVPILLACGPLCRELSAHSFFPGMPVQAAVRQQCQGIAYRAVEAELASVNSISGRAERLHPAVAVHKQPCHRLS